MPPSPPPGLSGAVNAVPLLQLLLARSIKYYVVKYYTMDIRRSERVIFTIPAEIIIGDKRYACSIENLSGEGAYVVTASTKNSDIFSPATSLELKFKFPSGENHVLNCRVEWSYLTPPHGYTNSIGLNIIDPPLSYKNNLKYNS